MYPYTLIPEQRSITQGADTGLRIHEDSFHLFKQHLTGNKYLAPYSRVSRLPYSVEIFSSNSHRILTELEKKLNQIHFKQYLKHHIQFILV